MAPHSSTLASKIPWTEEPAVHGVTEGRTRLSEFTFTFHFHALEKEMETHSSVLAWRIPGMGEPGGLPSMGSHRVGHDWSDLAAAAEPLQVYTLSHKLLVNNPWSLIIHPKSVLLCYIWMYCFLSPCFSNVCIITSAKHSGPLGHFPRCSLVKSLAIELLHCAKDYPCLTCYPRWFPLHLPGGGWTSPKSSSSCSFAQINFDTTFLLLPVSRHQYGIKHASVLLEKTPLWDEMVAREVLSTFKLRYEWEWERKSPWQLILSKEVSVKAVGRLQVKVS